MSDYIHALSESVERIHVRYPNRYGLMLAAICTPPSRWTRQSATWR